MSSLRWAVKASFVRYVRVLAAGTVEVRDGAVLGADDVIEFPLLSDSKLGDAKLSDGKLGDTKLSDGKLGDSKLNDAKLGDGNAYGNRVLDFGGGVRFLAHHGALDVDISGLRVVLGPGGGEISVDGRAIASLPGAGPLVPTLTEPGVAFFGNVYPAGTGLAPLDLAVPSDSAVPLDS